MLKKSNTKLDCKNEAFTYMLQAVNALHDALLFCGLQF